MNEHVLNIVYYKSIHDLIFRTYSNAQDVYYHLILFNTSSKVM